MFSKMTKAILFAILGSFLFTATAQAQDEQALMEKMSQATAMTKVDIEEALRQYLEIRAQYSGKYDPAIDYSLGRTYQRMNQCAEAQYYLTRVMSYNLPETDNIYKRAVKDFDEIATCQSWQKLEVECEIPKGGYATIDGERVTSCWGRPYSLKDGEHKFELVDAKGNKIERTIIASSEKQNEKLYLAFPPKKMEVEKIVNVETVYEYKDKYHPALYWGLIAGGAVVTTIGGFMTGVAGNAKADEQKYADLYALASTDELRSKYDKKRKDANDRVKSGNAAMYSLVSIGGAAIISGIVIAVLNVFEEKERTLVDDSDVNAYITPVDDGVSMGFGMRF